MKGYVFMKSRKCKAVVLFIALIGSAGMLTVPNNIVPQEHFSVCAAESTMSAPSKPRSQTGTDSVKLSWNSVSGADAYTVYYKRADKEEYIKYKTVKNPECLIKDLKPGTPYSVKVTPIKLNEKSVVTERGKSAVWTVKTAVYNDIVQNLKATSKLGGSKTEMYAGGEMVNYSQASVTLSWDILPSADAYVIANGSNVYSSCDFYQKNGRAYATIDGLYAASKYNLTVYPVKFENGLKAKGKGRSITFTTAAPKFSQLLDLGALSDFTSLGNNTYLSTGEYSAYAEEISIAAKWAIKGGDLSSLSTDVPNLDRHYITYNGIKIGIINFYTDPYNSNYLKIVIQDL